MFLERRLRSYEWLVSTTKSRGQSLVEFALTLPFLLLILLGAVDLGRGFYYQVGITGAAREGVRTASVYTKTDAEIKTSARNEVASTIPLLDSHIAVDPSPVRSPGQPVTVTVAYDFAALTPVVSRMMGNGSIRIIRSAAAVVQ